MKKVAVGSKNPTKIEAVKLAFEAVWPDERWEVEGVDVDSGVSSQPMSARESFKGATNRAKRALKQFNADFGVGLEGGIQKIAGAWLEGGWIVIIDKNGKKGMGTSILMNHPQKILDMINRGMELGEVTDLLFKRSNSKQAEGHFGIMTKNLITRTSGYRDGVITALVRFIHPDLYD